LNVSRQMAVLMRGTLEVVDPPALEQKLIRAEKTGRPLVVKLGLDPSAPDIHLGHTVVLEKLRQFQDFGHQVVLLIGDFTGRVGDPTDKSATRRQLSAAEVEAFARTYVDQAVKVLDPTRLVVRYNSEWLGRLTLEDLVHLMAQMTLARLLEREDFRRRLETHAPLHLHELLYPLMQGYDSVALGADVELGGSDQRFNIMTARQIQAAYGQEPEVGMFMPLLEGLDGIRKMSKSFGNYVGVTEPPAEMFGKIMSIPDGLVGRWGTLLLGWAPERAEGISGPAARDLKADLAEELVRRFWSDADAKAARDAFDATFRAGAVPATAVPVALPSPAGTAIAAVDLVAGLPGVPSRSEARRLLEQHAVTVDGRRLALDDRVAVRPGSWVRVGRHRFYRFEEA
jgi:tyrosyl-tRNA synthetase